MKDIEELAIKLSIKETEAKNLEQQLLFDELLYGKSVVSIDKDGNRTRLHPMSVFINDEDKSKSIKIFSK